MLHHNHHHYFFAQHLKHAGSGSLEKFYLASFLHDMGAQMLSVFILFYLYQLGWPLVAVVAYLLVHLLFKPIFNYLGSRLLIKSGLQMTILLSSLARIALVIVMFNLSEPSAVGYALLGLTALLDSASFAMYFMSWDFLFSGLQTKEQAARQISTAWAITAFTGFLAPLAGGLLAQNWDFKVSLIFASVLLVLSVVPLIMIRGREPLINRVRMKKNLNFGKYQEIFKTLPRGFITSYTTSNAIFNVLLPLWLLYLAVAVFSDNAYSGLGAIVAFSALVTIAVSILAGKLIDKGRRATILKGGAYTELSLGIMRLFITGIPAATLHNFLHQQAWAHNMVVFKQYYSLAASKSAERLAFLQTCSLAQSFAHALVVGLVIVLLLIFSNHQLDVLKYICVALGFAGLLLLFGASSSARRAPQESKEEGA